MPEQNRADKGFADLGIIYLGYTEKQFHSGSFEGCTILAYDNGNLRENGRKVGITLPYDVGYSPR